MLHKIFVPGPWFAAKRLGIGASWPIAWQGWALLAAYTGVIAGLGMLLRQGGTFPRVAALVVFLGCTAVLLEIVRRRTDGGWHWEPSE
jgi:hypothetical protein